MNHAHKFDKLHLAQNKCKTQYNNQELETTRNKSMETKP